MKRALGGAAIIALCATVGTASEVGPSDVIFVGGVVKASLTGQAGDAASGRKVFANRKLGNCLACHTNTDMPEHRFHGEVGPSLDGVAGRWSAEELRGILTNAKMTFEGTIMPAFYVDANYVRPLGKFEGKSILSAQQVEDVIAYLMTLADE